jgi:hypothetical protein
VSGVVDLDAEAEGAAFEVSGARLEQLVVGGVLAEGRAVSYVPGQGLDPGQA